MSADKNLSLFLPEERTALFAPGEREISLSPEGLYFLGVIKQVNGDAVPDRG